jgi:hypothetical protein
LTTWALPRGVASHTGSSVETTTSPRRERYGSHAVIRAVLDRSHRDSSARPGGELSKSGETTALDREEQSPGLGASEIARTTTRLGRAGRSRRTSGLRHSGPPGRTVRTGRRAYEMAFGGRLRRSALTSKSRSGNAYQTVMAETENIKRMADDLAARLFPSFGWERFPIGDKNWLCEHEADHKAKTHSTDAVFWYQDPYQEKKIYIIADLKSYAEASIQASNLVGDLASLCDTVDCANRGSSWSDVYVPETVTDYEVHGMLFVFNHDGKYTRDFTQSVLMGFDPAKLRIRGNEKIVVLGPQDIVFLASVQNDIAVELDKRNRPAPRFWHPDLVSERPSREADRVVTIEEMLGRWIGVESINGDIETRHIYTELDGASAKEYEYLIDMLFRRRLVTERSEVKLCMPRSVENAQKNFEAAKIAYVEAHATAKDRLKQITRREVPVISLVTTSDSKGVTR